MCCLTLIFLLASCVCGDTQDSMDNSVSNLIGRAINALFIHQADLDSTTVEKPGHLASYVSASSALPAPSLSTSHISRLFPIGGQSQPTHNIVVQGLPEQKVVGQLAKGDPRSRLDRLAVAAHDASLHHVASMVFAASSHENVKILNTQEDLAASIVDQVIIAAAESIKEKSNFVLALANSPSVGKALAGLVARANECDFSKWTLLFVNERCSEGQNAKRALETWTEKVGLPATSILKVGNGTPAEEASNYAANITTLVSQQKITSNLMSAVPALDCVLLGTGADGHVGSIKPASEQLADESGLTVLPVEEADKMAITLSLRTINSARRVVVAASGANKASVIANAINGDRTVPIGQLKPSAGTLTWLLDTEAAKDLRPE